MTKITFLIAICCSFIGTSQSFTNPIADLPDPHISYINGYYYYTGTTGGDVSIKRATSLEGLKQVSLTRVFGSGDLGSQQANYWAPELFRINNKWYIYYTASQTGTDLETQRTYVLENTNDDPLSNNWVFKSKIYPPGLDYWAIDGTVFELSGQYYFLWSGVNNSSNSSGISKPQRIYISLMTNPWTLTSSRTLLSSPGDLSGGNFGDVNEGPEILKNNNKIFLIYSANGCWTAEYKLGMLSMNDTDNPLFISSWTKYPNPVLVSNPDNNSYGPGHNSFFKSPDGTQDWLAYHATPNPSGECGNTRTSRAQQITFDANGVPQFGEVTVIGEPLNAPKGEPILPTQPVIENGLYTINQLNTTKLVEIGGAVYTNPANIIQWENNGGLGQQWWIQATGDGYYTIISALSGLAMEVGACDTNEQANINIWPPNGANCQLWAIVANGTGDYRIVNKNSEKVMEVDSGGINSNGANIQQSGWVNSSKQRFNIQLIKKRLNLKTKEFQKNIVIHPNPNNGGFTITGLNSDNYTIKIMDMLGKQIKTIKPNNNYKVNIDNLKPAIYFIQIISKNNLITKKIIIDYK
tara:strand:+ start:13532 stop:15268 length:1737 start_codon:yes stop_codon:yes gene_type:complete